MSRQVFSYTVNAEGMLTIDRPYDPAVVTACWGRDYYFECLALFLRSLREFGCYMGQVVVFSDRDFSGTFQHVPEALRGPLKCLPICSRPWLQRYFLAEARLADFSPVLYLDTDIIVDSDISATLARVASSRGLCVSTEREHHVTLWTETVARLPHDVWCGGWFGLDLMKADEACQSDFLPLANSGILGFTDHDLAFSIGEIMSDLFSQPALQGTAGPIEQPVLNYVLSKLRVADTDSLLGSCQFTARWTEHPVAPRGFMHFCWTPEDEKSTEMRAYLAALQDAYAEGDPTHRTIRLPAALTVAQATAALPTDVAERPSTDTEPKMGRGHINSIVVTRFGGMIQSGPFRGMKLTPDSCWGDGDITPKLLGTYEEELHVVLEEFFSRDYNAIVNIGSAEGYYAIGCAIRRPKTPVYAYDANPNAAAILERNAALNDIAWRITVSGNCEADDLISLAKRHSSLLVISDCEGYETTLFGNASVADALSCSDVIVECHDFRDPNCTPTVFAALWRTHLIEIIYSGSRNPNRFPILSRYSDSDRWAAVSENRPELMNWLVCRMR